ncbi:MAG: hypothetical protein ABSG53_14915, partial [Thermoguttaceae bacterium]
RAIWPSFGLFSLLPLFALKQPGALKWFDEAILLVCLCALVAFMASFGTTILGVVAIGQIKHSKGRLYGMPLAVFDALVFPLLLLDAVALVSANLVADRIGGPEIQLTPLGHLLVNLLFAGPLVWLDWRIIRGVWRNATGYQAPPKPSVPIPPAPSAQTPCN